MQTLNAVASLIHNATTSSDVTHLSGRACLTLTQLSATLEQPGEYANQLDSRVEAVISELRGLHSSLSNETLDSKLRRAVEKCRKCCLKALLQFQSGTSERFNIVRVLEDITAFLEHAVNVSRGTLVNRRDETVASLDTLFQIGRAHV